MKNYFTDSQVKALAKKSGIDISYLGYFHELKRLMNLAVETAIGEPDGWKVPGPYERVAFQDKSSASAFCEGLIKGYGDAAYFVTPLYSVKELEN